jgi:hypothetical protein
VKEEMERSTEFVMKVIAGALIFGSLLLFAKVIFDALFNDISASKSKGKLLARKERYVTERTEYYERGIEYTREELLKTEVFEPKKFIKIYGRKEKMMLP